MSADLERLQNTFLEEASEHLLDLERGLLEVEEDPSNLDLFQGVFRAAHSIKGGSGIFGFETITRLTHALENVLDRMRKAELEATTDRIDVLLRAVDSLGSLLDDAKIGRPATRDVGALIQELTKLLGGQLHFEAPTLIQDPEPSNGLTEYRISYTPHPNSLPETTDPLLLLRNLAKRGSVKLVTAKTDGIPLLDQFEPRRCYLSWEIQIESELGLGAIESVFEFTREFCDLKVIPLDSRPSALSASTEIDSSLAFDQHQSPGLNEDHSVENLREFLAISERSRAISVYIAAEYELFRLAGQFLTQFDLSRQLKHCSTSVVGR